MSNLNVASRALTANLAALQVVGNNIANVNTEGYSRQTVQLTAVEGQRLGGAYYGKGVEVASVTRAYDELLTREAQLTKSTAASDAVRYQRLQQLEDLFPLGDTGLGSALNKALNAWVDVASSPTDLTARTVAISSAQSFAQRLNDITNNIDSLRLSARQQVDSTLATVNTLAKNIATLNLRIIEGTGAGAVPNDLLDQRDQLVSRLNQYVQTRTLTADSGAMTVFIGDSLPLVLAGQAYELADASRLDPPPEGISSDPQQVQLALKRDGQPYLIAESLLRGGELDGMVQVINHDLNDTANQLGRLALSFALQLNQQHRLGLDLNGKMGGDLFSLEGGALSYANGVATIAGVPQGGAAGEMTAQVVDPTKFIASDYEVHFDPSDPTAQSGYVLRKSDQQTFNFAVNVNNKLEFGVGAAASTTLDGLEFALGTPAPAAGESHLFRPFADASRNIAIAIGQPTALAAASPVLVEPALQGGSSLGVQAFGLVGMQLASPTTTTLPGGLPSVSLSYSAATGNFTASIPSPGTGTVAFDGGGSGRYAPGEPLRFTVTRGGETFSYSLTLSGTPASGDTLTVRPPGAGEPMQQNAGNAKALLALRDQASFEGVSLSDGYVSVFGKVADKVQAGKFAADFSNTKATAAESARSNLAGVNLDEEAARLLQYQQSYQAAAKYLQVAQSTFDTLLGSFQ